MTKNPKIGNTFVWVLPNIWRLGRVMDTKFGASLSDKMLLNAAKCQGYIFYCFRVIKGKPTGWGVNSVWRNILTFAEILPHFLCFCLKRTIYYFYPGFSRFSNSFDLINIETVISRSFSRKTLPIFWRY